jgi:soluble lytic murein transglycosylase-like protein
VDNTAKKYGLPVDVLGGLINRESKFQPGAVSPSGASGIAQIVPKFHPGVNTRDPLASIDYAGKYLAENLKRFGSDMSRALAAYNHGPTAVASYGSKWRQKIPKETRAYIEALAPLAISREERLRKLRAEALKQ